MSKRILSVLAVGAFAAALSPTLVKPAAAQDDQPTPAQAKIREKNTARVKSGKVEPCFGVALKGHNDCYAGAGTSCAMSPDDCEIPRQRGKSSSGSPGPER